MRTRSGSTRVLTQVLTRVITGLLAGLVVAAGVVVSGAGATAATPECRNADLAVGYHARDAATSHRYGWIVVRNTSDRTCTVRGYGGLSYVGHGDGTQIGAAATRERGKVRTVVLRPGGRARSLVTEAVAEVYPKGECRPQPVDGFRVYSRALSAAEIAQFAAAGT